jgi:hypothetical protein
LNLDTSKNLNRKMMTRSFLQLMRITGATEKPWSREECVLYLLTSMLVMLTNNMSRLLGLVSSP